MPAIEFLETYYNANVEKELVGGSVPATEHSVMCMGEKEKEIETFRRLIEDLYPSGIVSIVSDTWDFWQVLTEYLPALKDKIMARTGGTFGDKVVIRPDSGDPVKIICGDESAEPGTAEHIGAVELLWGVFGGTVNEKGYKELDSHIGLIYGDSITPQRAIDIMEGLKAKGFASTNVVFGIGSYTYQHVTRDTPGLAMKATYGEVNGKGRNIFKDPKTDSGTKKSHCGLLKVERNPMNGNRLETRQEVSWDEANTGELKPVFKDGKLLRETTLSEIREKLK